MASLLAVLEDLRVSSRYGNRRAFQKTQRRMYDCKRLGINKFRFKVPRAGWFGRRNLL